MEFKWDPSMSVGEKTIDSQHKKLLEKITELAGIISSMDVDMNQLRGTVHFLYIYIKEHFTYEENYMTSNKFPDLEEHKKTHQDFVQFYDGLQKEFRERCISGHFSSVDIMDLLKKVEKYLGDWLVHHIKGMDQEYTKYINSRN